MRISDWSSDVCSSDLFPDRRIRQVRQLVDERPAVRACAADREVQRRRQSGDGIRIERIAFRDAVEVQRIVTVGKRRGLCGRDSGKADPRQQSKNRFAHYITDRVAPSGVQITRLAHGVPVGGELDYLDDGTLGAALKARRPL